MINDIEGYYPTFPNLSTDEHIVLNLFSGTPATSKMPFKASL